MGHVCPFSVGFHNPSPLCGHLLARPLETRVFPCNMTFSEGLARLFGDLVALWKLCFQGYALGLGLIPGPGLVWAYVWYVSLAYFSFKTCSRKQLKTKTKYEYY